MKFYLLNLFPLRTFRLYFVLRYKDVISVLLGAMAVAGVGSKPTFAKLVYLYFSTVYKKWNLINICLWEIVLVYETELLLKTFQTVETSER